MEVIDGIWWLVAGITLENTLVIRDPRSVIGPEISYQFGQRSNTFFKNRTYSDNESKKSGRDKHDRTGLAKIEISNRKNFRFQIGQGLKNVWNSLTYSDRSVRIPGGPWIPACDGMWGVGLGVIGAILGISAGCVSHYGTFKGLYIAQSVFVSYFHRIVKGIQVREVIWNVPKTCGGVFSHLMAFSYSIHVVQSGCPIVRGSNFYLRPVWML